MAFIKPEDIINATNGGLDIILHLYPDAAESVHKPNRKFKTRDEKTASAKLNTAADGSYLVIDFGGDNHSRNAINCYAFESKCDYPTALKELAARYNVVSLADQKEMLKAAYSDRPAAPEDEEGKWLFDLERASLTDMEIETLLSKEILGGLGWFSGEDKKKEAYSRIAAAFKYLHLHPVTSYSIVKNRKVMTFSATDRFPMFLIDETTHKKIYQPLHLDKGLRFMYEPGKKPVDFIHGMVQLRKAYAQKMEMAEDTGDAEDDSKKGKKKKEYKLQEVILCTGVSDALNVHLAGSKKVDATGYTQDGYQVIWLNSETAKLKEKQHYEIMTMVERLYQLGDIDATGKKQAHLLAMEYLDIYNIELPEELMQYRDSRGNPCKDVRDYFNHFKRKAFRQLLDTAMPYRFWEKKANYNRQGEFQGFDYAFDNEQGYNFLQKNGFYRLPVGNKDTDSEFIRIDGNTVKFSSAEDIRQFIKKFMRDRYLDKDLKNAIYRTAQLNESSLTNLDKVEIDFTDFDKETQYLFFQNKTLEVSAKGIKEHKPGAVKRFIWDDEVYQHRYESPEVDPFTITRDDLGTYDITVNNKECLFLKFLTQTSRMHWRTELEERLPTSPMTPEQRDQYVKDNQYNIAGPLLTDMEIEEQKRHMVNKVFIIGYLMHRYKDRGKPWFVFAMDGKLNDDGQSHGGSGKSIVFDMAMRALLKRHFMLNGRDPKLTENPHKYDGLTEHHRYIFIDDAHKYLNLDVFYTDVTGDTKVNPKGKSPYTIPFEKSGKLSFSSNYTPNNLGPSTERRMIYCVFSDYYHNAGETTDYKETRDPKIEFGKNMFTDFTPTDWNNFYTAAAHCLRFYLSATEKINPGMNNVNKRNLTNIMGANFHDWANAFFSEDGDKVNTPIVRDIAFKDYTFNNGGKMTPQSFFERLKAFCKLNGYTLNPKKYLNSKGKIIQKVQPTYYDHKTNIWMDVTGPKVTKELLFIQTVDDIPDDLNMDGVGKDTTLPQRYLATDQLVITADQIDDDFPIDL
jgi:hypothetical protein